MNYKLINKITNDVIFISDSFERCENIALELYAEEYGSFQFTNDNYYVIEDEIGTEEEVCNRFKINEDLAYNEYVDNFGGEDY